MLAGYILTLSVLIQFLTVFAALMLIRVTGNRISWILISIAIFVMALRRSISLFQFISGQNLFTLSLPFELAGLAGSILMLGGVILITPLFRGMVDEIVQRKEAEAKVSRLNQQLLARAAQLETAYKGLESFSYSVSHDLREPLMIINWYSRSLLKNYADKLDVEGIDLVNVISKSGENMDRLITDLLTFSRINTREICKYEIDVEEIATKIFRELQPKNGKPEVCLDVKQLPAAFGDPSMLRQVFSNLLSNAMKYARSGELLRIEIAGYEEGDKNIYYVKDNGIGFHMSDADKLFKSFQRLHTHKEFTGTGIGLVIVKNIIEKHNGKVWAEGKVNEGAAFYFSLPKKETCNESLFP